MRDFPLNSVRESIANFDGAVVCHPLVDHIITSEA